MLVLSRKPGQKIIIGDDIEIIVIESSSNNVKIGIEAPKDIPVFREEIWREIKESNLKAQEADCNTLDELAKIVKENRDFNRKFNKAATHISVYRK